MVKHTAHNGRNIGSSPIKPTLLTLFLAKVVKLADTLDLGSSSVKGIGVRLPSLVKSFNYYYYF